MRALTWQLELEKFCLSRKRMPFEWGKNDCAIFAADCVLALTGKDFAEPWRGYRTKEEADALLNSFGGLEQLAIQCLGLCCSLQELVPGDVVLVELETKQHCLGIFTGGACMGPGNRGTMLVPFAQTILAWKI